MAEVPNVQSILESTIKHTDLSIIAYLSNILQQAVDDGTIFSENDVYNSLCESLTAYGLTTSEQECYELTSSIFTAMVAQNIVKDPEVLKKETISQLSKGMMVMSQFSEDMQWYHARVDNITDTEVFVTYTDYGNSEWVDPLRINIIAAPQSITSKSNSDLNASMSNLNVSASASSSSSDLSQTSADASNNNNNSADAANAGDGDEADEKVENVAHSTGGSKNKGIKLGEANRVDTDVSAKINQLMYKTSRFLTDTTRSDKKVAEIGLTSRQKKKLKEEMKEKEKVLRFDPKRYMKSMRQKARPEWFDVNLRKGNQDVLIRNYTMSTLDEKHTLLENCDVQLNRGVRYGFVGLNGSGKTTLLRRMSRYDIAGFPSHLRILHVEQEVLGDETTVLDYVLGCDVVRKELLDRQKKLLDSKKEDGSNEEQIGNKLADLYQLMDTLGVLNVEPRAKEVLSGLGFTDEMINWPTNRLSGGWRMRVSLASALFVKPDILLLDEPTNHLDFPSVVWLENYLQNFEGTLLVVSHDREFLNNTAQVLIHLHNRTLEYFKGNFKSFIETRKRRYTEQMKAYTAQQDQIAHIKSFIDKFRYNAKKASLVQSRIKTLRNMERIEKPEEAFTMKFTFPPAAKVDGTVVSLRNVTFGYDANQILLNGIDVALDQKSRVGVIGANGAGKSTMINLMLGKLQPLFGEVTRDRRCRIKLFTQHHMDQLDLSLSPLDYLLERFSDDCRKEQRPAEFVRGKLGKFGLTGDLVLQRMVFLSGGQKSRVAFTVLTWEEPNFIIMDEPTNHLDVETIEALIDAINEWNGGLLVVSHDQHFLKAIAKNFWALSKMNGKISRFETMEEAKNFAIEESALIYNQAKNKSKK